MKIGVYSGSFDPIHTGHAMIANFISQCGVVDKVILMVSRRNPLKPESTKVSEFHRLQMSRLVAEGGKAVEVSDLEIHLPSPSYTYDTLVALRNKYPCDEIKLIVGSDSLERFSQWRNHDKIIKEFGLIVYPRPGYPLSGEEPDGMTYLTGAPEFSISSTLVREYIASDWNINFFVPEKVAEYIANNHLYEQE